MLPDDLTDDQIDDAVGEWHKSESTLPLHEWLGWTWEEFAAWAKDPDQVPGRKVEVK